MATGHSYIRFSRLEQSMGASLDRQLEKFRRFCSERGLVCSEKSYQDLGVSGWSGKKRDGLLALQESVASGAIASGDWIIVESLDRWSRRGEKETKMGLWSITEKGVNVYFVDQGIAVTPDSDNDMAVGVLLSMYCSLAKAQSDRTSERVLDAKARQRERARSGDRVPKSNWSFWLDRNNDLSFSINSKRVIVDIIIESRLDRVGVNRIAKTLNTEGHRAPRGGVWSGMQVTDVIRSKSLYGCWSSRDGDIGNYFPALVDRSTWELIQIETGKWVSGGRGNNWLAGLVRCVCGGTVFLKTMRRSGKEYKTWVCKNYGNGSCSKTAVRDLHLAVIASVGHFKADCGRRNDTRHDGITLEIESLQTRLKSLSEALMESGDVQELVKAIVSVKKAIAEKEKSRSFEILDGTADGDTSMLDGLKDDPSGFNNELRKHVSSIVVDKRSNTLIRVSITQRNHHLVNICMVRGSQRQDWRYLVGRTEDMVEIGSIEPSRAL